MEKNRERKGACRNRLMNVTEARKVCQDCANWRSVVCTYPNWQSKGVGISSKQHMDIQHIVVVEMVMQSVLFLLSDVPLPFMGLFGDWSLFPLWPNADWKFDVFKKFHYKGFCALFFALLLVNSNKLV